MTMGVDDGTADTTKATLAMHSCAHISVVSCEVLAVAGCVVAAAESAPPLLMARRWRSHPPRQRPLQLQHRMLLRALMLARTHHRALAIADGAGTDVAVRGADDHHG